MKAETKIGKFGKISSKIRLDHLNEEEYCKIVDLIREYKKLP